MLQIQFITVYHYHCFRRQLSTERFARDNIRFCFGDENFDHCDYCVVYEELPADFKLDFPRHKLIFVASEPRSVRRYPENFLAQFGTVITSDRHTPHPDRLFVQQGLLWHIGLYNGVDEYRREPMTIDTFRTFSPEKHKLVSVICSDKISTEQHRDRLSFVARLREHFGERLDVFGRGVNTFVDKEEVISPYRYHIALENCDDEDYWTEKISDPILALTYPIYYGCKNLDEYLPDGCFTRIDIAQPEQAIEVIEATIASDKYETSQKVLREARELILDEHNIFALVARVIKKLQASPDPMHQQVVTVRHRKHRYFKWERRLRRVLNFFQKNLSHPFA